MTEPEKITDGRWPHRIACMLSGVAFLLILLGAVVTTTDAGMAVPDWPNTYGYNLFLYPVEEWFFGPWDLFVEHGHRLLATLAGLISIALVLVCWGLERRRWVRLFSVALLILVVMQGVLGGVRVLFDDRDFAKIHGCVGPAFFAAVVAFCATTNRWWARFFVEDSSLQSSSHTAGQLGIAPKFAIVMLSVSYLQLVLGAFVRHIDDAAPPNQFALLIACHILTAIVIVVGTLFQFALTRQAVFRGLGIRGSIDSLVVLVGAQFCLGIGTWVVKFGWPVWFENQHWASSYVVQEKSSLQVSLITAHAAIGSLILAFWTIQAMRINRVDALLRTKNAV